MGDFVTLAPISLGALRNLLFAIAIGSLACDIWLGRLFRLARPLSAPSVTARLHQLLFISLGALGAAHIAYLWLQAASISISLSTSVSEAPSVSVNTGSVILPLLTQSHFGKAWLIGLGGLILAAIPIPIPTRASHPSHTSRLLTSVGLAVYAASKAGVSHAADAGDWRLPELIHWLHLLSTALWTGSVMVAAVTLSKLLAASNQRKIAQVAFCRWLSQNALIALAIVIVTGLYSVMHNTAGTAVVGTRYGQLLAIKISLVIFAIIFGGVNRSVYLRRLRHWVKACEMNPITNPTTYFNSSSNYYQTFCAFTRMIRIEAITMVLILIVAAAFGHTPPSSL